MAFTYTKRKDGRLMKRVSVNGRLETLYSDDPKDLERQYIEKKSLSHKGIFINDEGMTVGVWADKWVSLYKSDKEEATQDMYKDAIRLYIKPNIGNIPIKFLKQSDIVSMLNVLDKRGITRKKDVTLLTIKQILNKAVENDYIYKNVANGITIKKHKAPEKEPLNDKVITEVKKLAKTDFNAFMILFLIYTGLRREEIIPLQYKDINLEGKYILINKAVHFSHNQPVIKATKNYETRKVPIFNILYPQLETLKQSHKDNEYIFPNTLKKMMSETCIKRKLSYVIRDINKSLNFDTLSGVSKDNPELISFTLHQLRHTYACILYKADIDIKQAQVWMGDKTLKVLLEIYTHLDEEDNQNSVDKVNQFLG
jgi:integrase